jgi:phage terminase large subunit-like protein
MCRYEGVVSLTLSQYRAICAVVRLDNGQPFILDGWELGVARDLLTGIRETHVRIPEENGKTTFVAADNLVHLISHPAPRAVVAARNEKQAKILYNQAVAMVEATPALARRLVIRDGTNEIRLKGRKGNVGLQVIPADELSAHGAINTRVTIDEMHALPGLGLYRVLSGKLGKREGAQLIAISTAGEPDSEYELMWEEMLTAGGRYVVERIGKRCVRSVGPQSIAWCWALEKGDDHEDMTVVKRANPLRTITPATLQAKRDLPGWELAHWLRVVCNVPTRDQALRFLAEGDWDAANVAEDCPIMPPGVPVIVGADWGWADDSTAYVPAWYSEDGMLLLGPATVVEPPRNGTDLTPQEALRRLEEVDAVNPIVAIAHDETYGGKIMTGLLVERFPAADIIPVSQADAAEAPLHFGEQLRGGKLKHTGDPTLKRHLMNAVRVPIQDDPEHFRIKRLKGSRHAPHQRAVREIDAAIAAVNAVWGAVGREPTDDPFLIFLGPDTSPRDRRW